MGEHPFVSTFWFMLPWVIGGVCLGYQLCNLVDHWHHGHRSWLLATLVASFILFVASCWQLLHMIGIV